MNELVSIITPSYNTALFIRETIESVITQTYKAWEMIIIDDNSSDNSVEVIENLIIEKQLDKVLLLKNKQNLGAAYSRNLAIRRAKGRWIAFLDSDDLWEPRKLELQIQFMKENNFSFSYTPYQEIDESSVTLGRIIFGPKHIGKLKMYTYCWPGCLTVVYDADKVGLIQIKHLDKNNDYAMWLKVIHKTDCYLYDECLARYRRRRGSISSHSKLKLLAHHYRLFRYGQGLNSVFSLFLTFLNIIGGLVKKVHYSKRFNQNQTKLLCKKYN